MATPVACVAVSDAAAAPTHATFSNLPGLQLLLRILPLRSSGNNRQQLQQVAAKLPHQSALEELHRHPLWRYGSTAAQWPGPRNCSTRPLPSAEAESALLSYVRLAAAAEQEQGLRRQGHHRRRLSTADVAAELHALYTLAAVHVAQQSGSESSSTHWRDQQALSDGDFMQLLNAYAALEDRSHQSRHTAGAAAQQLGNVGEAWNGRTQAAAAAMEALWAFARLADGQQPQEVQQDSQQQVSQPQQQQQQQQPQSGQAPGQLQVSSKLASSATTAHKQPAGANGGQGSWSTGTDSSARSSDSSSGDLQVLLKLAQLGLQTAS